VCLENPPVFTAQEGQGCPCLITDFIVLMLQQIPSKIAAHEQSEFVEGAYPGLEEI